VPTVGSPGNNQARAEAARAKARSTHIPKDAVEGPLNDAQDHAGAVVESREHGDNTALKSPAEPPSKPLVLSKSLQTLLPVLHAQRPHYITAHIHRFPYLITEGDTLRLPFHLHGVRPGDILRFNRASLLGSRDYTLKAGMSRSETYDKKTNEPNYLDERLFECRVRILGVDSQPMTIEEKKKRRNRRVRTVKSKHKYTVCKVMEVKIKSLEELQGGGEVLLLE
jgi:large subunit ribosomal protein L21